MTETNSIFDYPFAPAGVVEFFREYYGPMTRAFEAVSEANRQGLRDDLVALWTTHNRATDPERTEVDAEYLEVVATRQP